MRSLFESPLQRSHRDPAPALVAAVVCLLSLLGCSANTPAGSDPTPAGAAAEITVTDDVGQVTVEQGVQRIVCLVDYCGDLLASIELLPVGAQAGAGGSRPAYLGDQYAELPSVGDYSQPSIEQIATLEPDLIIGLTTAHRELRDQLSKVAPTLMLEPRSFDDVGKHLDLVAKLVGKEDQATAALDDLEQKINTAVSELGADQDRSCLVMFSAGENIDILPINTVTPSAVSKVCPYAIDAPSPEGENFLSSNMESLVDADPDHLFVASLTESGDSAVPQLAKNPLWSKLSAVKADQVSEIDPTVWMYGRGPVALGLVLDELQTELKGAS